MITEFIAKNARAYDAGCIGCKRHGKAIMVSFLDEDSEKILDFFLGQEEAKFLHKELGDKIAQNEKTSA